MSVILLIIENLLKPMKYVGATIEMVLKPTKCAPLNHCFALNCFVLLLKTCSLLNGLYYAFPWCDKGVLFQDS